MRLSQMLNVIDSHTAGEPARIVVGGIPVLKGKTVAEKKQYLIDHKDNLRKSIMLEPRGHNAMFGAFLIPATSDEADFGIIFMDTGGYLNMCGHNTIAAVTAIVETGMVDIDEDTREKDVTLETPAGLVHATAHLDSPYHVKNVSFRNVPAFLYKKDVIVDVPDVGKVKMDISFGGSFFAILDIEQLNETIDSSNAEKLDSIGMKILKAVNEQVKVQHPTLDYINTVDLVEMYSKHPQSEDATMQNVVVFGDGQVDRSPCGTGTSAKLATLFAKGEIGINEKFVYESILNTEFTGRVIKTGSAVKKVRPGDRVAVNVETFCGECFYCRRGFVNNCTEKDGGWALGCRIDGGQAEYARIPFADNGLTKIPEGVTDEQALFNGDILSTGYWAAKIGEVKPADTVAVIGAGPTGLCTMLCARLYTPARIIAIDTDEYRLHLAKEKGLADLILVPGRDRIDEEIRTATEG